MKSKEANINRNMLNICPANVVGYSTEEEREQYLTFFKTCVLPRDINKLKETLKNTIDFRREIILEKETNFPELFPFYFVAP